MKKSSQPEPIEKIRRRFRKEWLLIAVDKVDEKRTIVLTGRLLDHDPDPLEIHKMSCKYRGHPLMTVYSDDWPKGLAAAFYAYFLDKTMEISK